MSKIWIFITLLIYSKITNASVGDRSQFYSNCIDKCRDIKCENDVDYKENLPLDLRLLHWTCRENCSYFCMWKTVDFFSSRGLSVPQFHGKWPFVRIFGLQEPASVLFSILNFYAHVTYYLKFKKVIRSTSPMFFIWTWFTVICLHGWFWSTVFHARDKDFTEVMDYSCAFTIMLTLLYCLLLRIFYRETIMHKAFITITSIYFIVLYSHLTHLWSGHINYEYNMKFNVLVGFLIFVMSMIWWYNNSTKLPHVHLMGWFTISTVTVSLLEIADFPPIFWLFDAHSLWHASTIPLVKLLYRFASLDCQYLRRQYSKLEDDRL
ncbi:PREDICTED: post-GPI attachment to proteins factor 3 [Ceratosolen solmsi marchali]|uniref:Post-GPI attachment to proteins factor 3 n=1 Tax=Ceratosolen solmsi marchali TaxID=326594 RepID=A0AAJ6YWY7_9HYME|nr:PREDICTED: post-GPI attachment to proteins factor 3 [Ceratosolen solmsi marchali]